MRYLITILVFALIFIGSCKPKQIIVEKEKLVTKYDTIRKDSIVEKQIPVYTAFEITEPCDSLGLLKEFKQKFKTKTVHVEVESKNGNININVNLDSIKEVAIKEYRESVKDTTTSESKETTIYRTSKWTWIFLIAAIVGWILAFRKYIPWLRFIPF